VAHVINDRVKETSTSTGTGTINLGGAVSGFETFVAAIGNSNTTYYCIAHQSEAEFEIGLGTVTDASPDTLARTSVISSSNSDSAVNFSAGTKHVFCTLPASKAFALDNSGNASTSGSVTGGSLIADNITIDSNTISTTDSNGNLNITPNGTGKLIASTTPFFSNFLGEFTASDDATLSTGSLFSDTYDTYDIYVRKFIPATDDVNLRMKLIKASDSSVISSNYHYYGATAGTRPSDSAQTDGRSAASTTAGWAISGQDEFSVGSESDEGYTGLIRVYNTRTSGLAASCQVIFACYKSVDEYFTNFYLSSNGSDWYTTAMSGVQLNFTSGNIASGTIRVFGIKME
tara:strand:- start:234 stop:1268 length:1035 start_codon:yes stop_codon:yes gene_type:complete